VHFIFVYLAIVDDVWIVDMLEVP